MFCTVGVWIIIRNNHNAFLFFVSENSRYIVVKLDDTIHLVYLDISVKQNTYNAFQIWEIYLIQMVILINISFLGLGYETDNQDFRFL